MESIAYALGGFVVSAFLGGLGALEARRQIKDVRAQIPKPPSDETIARDEQSLRDKINREVGVQLDQSQKQIKALQDDNAENKKEIGELKNENKQKDLEIARLNKQVARLEGEHENEETKREKAEERAHELDKENISLKTKLEIYPATLALIEQIITRPIQITLSLEGVIAKEVVKAEDSGISPEPKKEEVQPDGS